MAHQQKGGRESSSYVSFSNDAVGGRSSTSSSSSCCGNNRNKRQYQDDSLIDKNLAAEMNALSMRERQRVLEDIHAVAEAREETPEFVEGWISGLDNAVASLPRRSRTALERAIFLRPDLENNIQFKLKFLRADSFHVENAAQRYANYFSQKLRLFGDKKLVKKIALEDLTEKEIRILKSGCFILLPQKDPIGRTIVFVDVAKFDLSDQDSMVRLLSLIFLYMVIISQYLSITKLVSFRNICI